MVSAREEMMTPCIAVLIPCYNEEAVIAKVVRDGAALLGGDLCL